MRQLLTEPVQYAFADAAEIPEVARLVGHSFPGPTRTAAWVEAQLRDPRYGGGADTLFVGRENGRPVAALQLHLLNQWIAGERLPIAGVATVSIAPTHRQKGLAGDLVTQALRAARERGDLASALYPFRVSFYQKLGYGLAGVAQQYQVAPKFLPDSPERRNVVLLDTDTGRAEALAFYNRWAQQQTGQLERQERLWRELVTMHDRALVGYRTDDGTLEGYALVTYRADLPFKERYLEVEEVVWSSAPARRGLYAWLSSLGDQWPQLALRALPSHRLDSWIREPRLPPGAAPVWGLWAPTATLMTGPMFRLIDLRKTWARRAVQLETPLRVAFDVIDEAIAENNGTLRLTFADGRVQLDSNTTPDVTLRLTVSTLSRLYIAALTPAEAYDADLLECDRPEKLEQLGAALRLPEPWTFDRF